MSHGCLKRRNRWPTAIRPRRRSQKVGLKTCAIRTRRRIARDSVHVQLGGVVGGSFIARDRQDVGPKLSRPPVSIYSESELSGSTKLSVSNYPCFQGTDCGWPHKRKTARSQTPRRRVIVSENLKLLSARICVPGWCIREPQKPPNRCSCHLRGTSVFFECRGSPRRGQCRPPRR